VSCLLIILCNCPVLGWVVYNFLCCVSEEEYILNIYFLAFWWSSICNLSIALKVNLTCCCGHCEVWLGLFSEVNCILSTVISLFVAPLSVIHVVYVLWRFPKVDLRVGVDKPWWRRSLHPEQLSLELDSAKFKTTVDNSSSLTQLELRCRNGKGRCFDTC